MASARPVVNWEIYAVPQCPAILGPLMHSTTTVSSCLVWVKEGSKVNKPILFDEKELFPRLEPTKRVHDIECDYGRKSLNAEETPTPPKKRVGRKRAERPVKPRKHPGNGHSFHSQITFQVQGQSDRPTQPGDEGRKHCAVMAHKLPRELPEGCPDPARCEDMQHFIPDDEDERRPARRTQIDKTYKIKVFRNGNVTIPGSLSESMRDVFPPMRILCRYLSKQEAFALPTAEDGSPLPGTWLLKYNLPQSQMFNYKFRLREGCVNLYQFRDYCEALNMGTVRISPVDLRTFLLRPTFPPGPNSSDDAASPGTVGWRRYLADKSHHFTDVLYVDVEVPPPTYILSQIVMTKTPKTIICRAQQVTDLLARLPLDACYRRLCQLAYMLPKLSNEALERILDCWLAPALRKALELLDVSDNNFLVGVRYEQDTYAAMLIRFRSPEARARGEVKEITAKIFPASSGTLADEEMKQKINIDGARSRKEAELVYSWLNYHLAKSKAIFQPDYYSDDDEFSYTASEASSDSDDDSLNEL